MSTFMEHIHRALEPKPAYYYASTDDKGVLCVDRLPSADQTEDFAAEIADWYPDTIYFALT